MTVVTRLDQGNTDVLSLVLAAHHQGKVEITEVKVNRNVVTGPTWEMRLENPPVSADYGMLTCEPDQQRPAMLWLISAYKKLCDYVVAQREPAPSYQQRPAMLWLISAYKKLRDYVVAQREPAPSYHALHLTTDTIERTALKDLPFGVSVLCTRSGGWEVWHSERPPEAPALIAAEYAKAPVSGLRLDVAGHVIVDSLTTDLDKTTDL